jgi:hypothetical protein
MITNAIYRLAYILHMAQCSQTQQSVRVTAFGKTVNNTSPILPTAYAPIASAVTATSDRGLFSEVTLRYNGGAINPMDTASRPWQPAWIYTQAPS